MTNEAKQFTIGCDVRCSDGVCGELRRVVIEPVGRVLTHLVVEPKHRERAGRLVPIGLVNPTIGLPLDEIVLRCSLAEFETFESAQETQFLPGASGKWAYGQEQMLSWPYYRLGLGSGLGMGGIPETGRNEGTGMAVRTGMEGFNPDAGPHVVMREHVPVGEVQVRRGEHVHATDGSIGRVQGLVVDGGDHHVTHLLLDEGHLWGQKRVAVPIGAVTDVSDGVRLGLTKDQVRDLPPVELDLTEGT